MPCTLAADTAKREHVSFADLQVSFGKFIKIPVWVTLRGFLGVEVASLDGPDNASLEKAKCGPSDVIWLYNLVGV